MRALDKKNYYPKLDEKEFTAFYVKTIIPSMMKEFPRESRKIIKTLTDS